jgi:hypothetical protein
VRRKVDEHSQLTRVRSKAVDFPQLARYRIAARHPQPKLRYRLQQGLQLWAMPEETPGGLSEIEHSLAPPFERWSLHRTDGLFIELLRIEIAVAPHNMTANP